MASFQPLRQMSNLWRTSSLVQWSTGVPSPEDLVAIPLYLNPGNIDEAREYYAGRFNFNGELHKTEGSSPFDITNASPEWTSDLHGFTWLRHLHQAGSPIAKSNAQTLVRDWLEKYCNDTTYIAWTVEVTANRVISWLAHARLIIENSDQTFYLNFLQNIAAQTRYLILSVNSAPAGLPRLLAKTAIAYASLCMQGQSPANQKKQIASAANALGEELVIQFFADGGHITRNPDMGISAASVLLPLHHLYLQRQENPPIQLTNALDRMLPMLEFFAHPDGSVAHFNGSGLKNKKLLASVLKAGGHSGKPPENAALSGYQKMQSGRTKIIIDTGNSPNSIYSHRAHAACLSFEMSSGSNIIIVNCGAPAHHQLKLSQAARSTAAHSTAIINDTSTCQFQKNYVPPSNDSALISPPISTGIDDVKIHRTSNEQGEQVTASHNGYEKLFGITHQRIIQLCEGGDIVNGTDQFTEKEAEQNSNRLNTISIRFHLHPNLSTKFINNNVAVQLTSPNGESWIFTCIDARIEIGDSVYFHPESVQSKQILLSATIETSTEIRWVLEKVVRPDTKINGDNNPHSQPTADDLLDLMSRK